MASGGVLYYSGIIVTRFIGRIGSESGKILKFVLAIVSRPTLFRPAPSTMTTGPLLP